MWKGVVLMVMLAVTRVYTYENGIGEQSKQCEQESSLILAHVVFRHGDRTPEVAAVYPNDPYINETFYPYGKGHLTLLGKKRSYALGRALRERFNNFLGPNYISEMLEARSSEYPRAQMSLQSVLAGLFPPSKEYKVDDYLAWQPIPYSYSDYKKDKLIATFRSCPDVLQMHSDYEKTIQSELKQFKTLFEYLSEYTGWNITGTGRAYAVQNTLRCEEEWGFELPEWTKKIWPAPIKKAAVMFWKTFANTPALRSTIVGHLLNKIIADTKEKIAADNSKKLYLYSGHDFNIVSLLRAFGYWEDNTAPYSAYIIMEVHNINGVYGFKVFYQNYERSEPHHLRLPECGHFCPIDKFMDVIKESLATENWCNGILI